MWCKLNVRFRYRPGNPSGNWISKVILSFVGLLTLIAGGWYRRFCLYLFTKIHLKIVQMTELQPRKREWSSDGIDLGIDYSSKKKRTESSASEVNQSTSTSANDTTVHDLVFEQQPQPCSSQQRNVRFDSGNSHSSGVATAKQHGNNELNLQRLLLSLSLGFENSCTMNTFPDHRRKLTSILNSWNSQIQFTVCSGSVVVTVYDFESDRPGSTDRPGSNPAWGPIYIL